MARNYVEFWIARANIGGNYQSFAEKTRSKCTQVVEAYKNANPTAVIDISPCPAYFLINKTNVVGIVKTLIAHDASAWGSSWAFLQNGLVARASPRETWSHGH